ncbi:MAG: hypothetical protein IH621_07980 [Krumholzibacteria bacterium]|nr:hypothetical protein [Candidatus Krumholzibacteria bacterium]
MSAANRLSVAVAMLLVSPTLISLAFAQQCLDYRDYVHSLDVLSAGVEQFAVAGGFAYGAGRTQGLIVVDVTDPGELGVAAVLAHPWLHVKKVGLSGDRAYLINHRQFPATSDSSLVVVNVSDPGSPYVESAIATPSYVYDLAVDGSFAFVAMQFSPQFGVHVYDLSTPGTMAHRAYVPTAVMPTSVVAGAGRLAVTTTDGAVTLMDVSLPESPDVGATIPLPYGYSSTSTHLAGDTLYIAYYTAFGEVVQTWDVSACDTPVKLGETDAYQRVGGIVNAGGVTYIGCDGGLAAVDMADPNAPITLCFMKTMAFAACIVPVSQAFLVGGGADASRLEAVDLGPLQSAPREGTLDSYWCAYDVAVRGNYAYFANNDWNLQVVDVSDPSSPVAVWSRSLTAAAYALDLANDHVFIANGSGGLVVADLVDPARPRIVASLPLGVARDVKVVGDLAYVADDDKHLRIADVSDPSAPVALGAVATVGTAFGVDVQAGVACLATMHGGLEIFDVSDPSAPAALGRLDLGSCQGVTVAGQYAYVLSGGNFAVVDISDPAAPSLVGTFPSISTGWFPGHIAVDAPRRVAYAAIGDGGVVAIDISLPDAPRIVGNLATDASARGVALQDEAIYVAQDFGGMFVAPGHCPTPSAVGDGIPGPAVVSLRAYPNPFNPRVTIEYAIPADGSGELLLFDLRGRRVRTFDLMPGRTRLTWDGRDDAGRELPSGTYLMRVTAGAVERAGRITLLR